MSRPGLATVALKHALGAVIHASSCACSDALPQPRRAAPEATSRWIALIDVRASIICADIIAKDARLLQCERPMLEACEHRQVKRRLCFRV